MTQKQETQEEAAPEIAEEPATPPGPDPFVAAAQQEEQQLLNEFTLRAQAEHLSNRAVFLNAALRRQAAASADS